MPAKSIVTLSLAFVLIGAAPARAQVGGWVDANASLARPATGSISQTAIFPFRAESFEATHVYTQTSKPSFDLGGGIRFGRFGVGMSLTRYADRNPSSLSISVPNRFFFNLPSRAAATTQDPLPHHETAFHVEARYIVNLPHASIALFAGPSLFLVEQELITNDQYTETIDFSTGAQFNSIVGYDSQAERVRQWGYNVGADVSYYFSELVGVGAIIRLSQANAKLPNHIQSDQTGDPATTDVRVGGWSLGGGIRFRF